MAAPDRTEKLLSDVIGKLEGLTVKIESGDRIEKLLAMLLIQNMKGTTQAEKAAQLSAAGFSAAEIADMLGTTAAVIRQLLYTTRKNKKSRSSHA